MSAWRKSPWPNRQHGKRRDNHAPLGACLVDRRTDRRLHRDSEQTADSCHQTGRGLAPVLLGDQKDIQIRPRRPADIGEQEVDGIERQRVETTILAHPHHSHSNSVPIVSVMTVIGATVNDMVPTATSYAMGFWDDTSATRR